MVAPLAIEATPRQLPPDRVPPQDMDAEQCVLGAMLISKDAIADVVEVLRGSDFYRPAHEQVYDVVLDLYGRGEPVDAVTVADELGKRGEIARVGGAPYLHTLLASVHVAANAGYYADIVRDKAILRRLADASVRVGQLAYTGAGDVDQIVDRAQAEVYAVTERRAAEDYKPLAELMQPTLDEMEAISSRGGGLSGVPTGFADLDELTNGLHAGQMVVLAGRPGSGKALALDTPLPTPTGWTTMGEIRVGDYLVGADGQPTRVTAATEVLTERTCFRIAFSDGTSVVADAEHEWPVTSRAARKTVYHRQRRTRVGFSEMYHADDVEKLAALIEEASPGDDQLVALKTLSSQVPVGLRSALRRVAYGEHLGKPGRIQVQPWVKLLFQRSTVYGELLRRVDRPVNSWRFVTHPATTTTAEIAESVTLGDGRLKWAIASPAPMQLPSSALPLEPYYLGVWLGDGTSASSSFTSNDPEIAEHLQSAGFVVRPLRRRMGFSVRWVVPARTPTTCAVCGKSFVPKQHGVLTCGRTCGPRLVQTTGSRSPGLHCPDCGRPYSGGHRCADCHAHHGTVGAALKSIGVLHNKHIPTQYLRSSEKQRRDLLAGLLDTDGTVSPGGGVEFVVTSRRLASDFYELATSLGFRCVQTQRKVAGRRAASSVAYKVTFSTSGDVFRLTRKSEIHRQRRATTDSRNQHRYVSSAEPVPSVPVRCVQVDNSDHLYLATHSMIPTHNSTLALDLARSASIDHGLASVIFSLEMSQTEITMRLLSAEASVPLNHIRNGKMSDDDWTRVANKMGQVSEAPMFIDDSPNLTMMEIRAKARRLKQRHDLRLVVIDYIQLMTSGRKVESRQLEVSEFSRQIKLLAKELDLPVVALSQLNRGPEQRTDKKPMLSDLRESGSLEQDSDLVVLVHRPDMYDKESDRAGEADLDVAKHRNGPTRTVTVAFQGHYSRFQDMYTPAGSAGGR